MNTHAYMQSLSSTVVTGSAAIQKRMEAICSKFGLSRPTEKTCTQMVGARKAPVALRQDPPMPFLC